MNSFEMLENPWHQMEETFEEPFIGVIVDGITDFNLFLKQFQSLKDQFQDHQLFGTRFFLLINSGYKYLNNLKNEFECSHYQLYSIFLKVSYFDKFIDYLRQVNTNTLTFEKNLYYLFFKVSNISNKYSKISNFLDFKKISNSPPQYFYGFKTFSDLLKSYFILIKEGTNWPIFALPFKFIEKVNSQNSYDQNNFNHETTAKLPDFHPDENLFYMSFIEKEIKKPQKIQNCEEMYSIRNINDIQICHFFKEKIRTFLGFDNLFRLLHVFDYFLHRQKLNEFNDVILIENSMTHSIAFNKIRYDLFYIENQSPLFDSSLLYSLNYVDFCDLNSSYFYGFDDIDDFQCAFKILSNSKKIVINDVRLVESDEFNEKFDKKIAAKMLKTTFFYLVLLSQKSAITDFKTVFKRARVIEKNVNYKIDNQSNNKYALVGFETVEDRKNAFLALTKIQNSNKISCFYPEDQDIFDIEIKSTRKRRKRRRKSKKKNSQETENNQEEEYNENNNEYQINDNDVNDTNNNDINKDENDENNNFNDNKNNNFNDNKNNSLNDNNDVDNNKNIEDNDEDDGDDDDDYDNNENDAVDDNFEESELNDKFDSNKQNPNKIEKETNVSLKDNAAINQQKEFGSDIFSPNQSLIYLYFIEKEKARKISQGKQVKLSLFGVKKCKDIQRYKRFNNNKEENGYFTFFGFDKYEDTTAAINYIKSKWLSETTIKIYEHTKAFIQHNTKADTEDDQDEAIFLQAINDKKQKQQQQQQTKSNINNDSFDDLRINTYKALTSIHPHTLFYSQISMPNNIQLELKKSLTKSKTVINILKDIVSYNSSYEPFTYIIVDSINPINQSILSNVLSRHKMGFSLMFYEQSHQFHFLEFSERIIPINILNEFLHFLKLINEIEKIERNVFHFGNVVTIIYFQPSASSYIIQLIESFLRKKDCLFDYKKNSVKKAIHFNEEITLKKKEKDFELIVNEIKRIGINPIKIERNKLLLTKIPYNNNILQQLSFICFNSTEDKLNALNHINSVVLKDKNSKIVKFNPSLYYVQVDPFKLFPNNDQDSWKKLNNFAQKTKNVVDIQLNVASIESTADLAFIGFKSIKNFTFYYHNLLSRISRSVLFPNANLFNPDADLLYLQIKTSKDVDLIKLINNELLLSKIRDYQKNCSEFSKDGQKVMIVSFIGFENEQDRQFVCFNLKSLRNPNIVEIFTLSFDYEKCDITDDDELNSENLLTAQ